MYEWINSSGEKIRMTVKELAAITGMSESNARRLACGAVAKSKGFASTHRRAARLRKRFSTKLQNLFSGDTAIVGQSVAAFCRLHGLSAKNLHRVLLGKRLAYKGWTLAKSLELAGGASVQKPASVY